jgi:hypothetical protein
MATVDLEITVTRRWFFWPAFVVALVLVTLRLVSDEAAARWIAGHVFRIEPR